MTYVLNSQIDTSRDASQVSNAEDAARAEVIWGEAHRLYLQLRATGGVNFDVAAFDHGWQVHRGAGRSSLAAAGAALEHYRGILAKAVADDAIRAAARAEALSGSPSLASQHARAAYAAGPVLQPYWMVGGDLATLAAGIAANHPVAPHAVNSHLGSAPIGDDAELAAALDAAEASLAHVAAKLAGLRADMKARAKASA